MLCYVLTRLGSGADPVAILGDNPALVAWWTKHRALDADEEQRERDNAAELRRRREGLAKLSPQERAALGLNDSWRTQGL